MNETTYVFKAYPLEKGGYFIAVVRDHEKGSMNSEKDIADGKEALSNVEIVTGKNSLMSPFGPTSDMVKQEMPKSNDAEEGDKNA